jgi:hypothetical protein
VTVVVAILSAKSRPSSASWRTAKLDELPTLATAVERFVDRGGRGVLSRR